MPRKAENSKIEDGIDGEFVGRFISNFRWRCVCDLRGSARTGSPFNFSGDEDELCMFWLINLIK